MPKAEQQIANRFKAIKGSPSIKLGNPSYCHVLDAALIGPSPYFEETLVAPAGVPAVGHQPVGHLPLHSPPHDLDCVVASLGPVSVLVDPALVGEEVLVAAELYLDWPVLQNLSLHFGHVRGHPVDSFCLVSVLLVTLSVLRNALLDAVRGVGYLGAGPVFAFSVVIAGGKLVGVAVVCVLVEPTCDNPLPVPVVHGAVGVTAPAAVATEAAAAQHVGC